MIMISILRFCFGVLFVVECLGNSCKDTDQCAGQYVVCSYGYCVCSPGYRVNPNNGACEPGNNYINVLSFVSVSWCILEKTYYGIFVITVVHYHIMTTIILFSFLVMF